MNTKQEQFTNLFKHCKHKLYNIAYSVVLNKEEAEDVLQDAYIKAWRKFEDFDKSKKFLNWMSAIVKNAAIDHKRSTSKQMQVYSLNAISSNLIGDKKSSVSFDVEDKKLDLFDKYEQKEFIQSLNTMINDLPKELKLVMIPFAQGQSYDEIAKTSKLALTTVRARVHRAKKLLRNSYNSKFFANFI
jgi:RNA polymerase sigma-70 factor (ECF subfamily)